MYLWQTERRFNAYADYFKRIFGKRVQKVTINAGFTCPNRDGTLSTKGCLYCDNAAFNPSYCHSTKSITQQIKEGIDFHKNRYRRAEHYLAYFQAFSNTYAPIEHLQHVFEEALACEGVVGLVIATRPDCIDQEKLDYLAKLSEKYYIIVEYGIESCNDNTLLNINRGHDFECAKKAIFATKKAGLNVGAHFIFGLPHETPQQWLLWSDIISQLPLDTVKFHQLQIIKGTNMQTIYNEHPEYFYTFTLQEYIQFIIQFLERLNPNIVVERFAGEVPPRFLEHSNWGLIRNDQILLQIEKELLNQNTYQGRLFKEC